MYHPSCHECQSEIKKESDVNILIEHPLQIENAFPKRWIVDDSDVLIAFPSKHGKGTQITIDMANKKGIPVHVVDDWEGEEE